ncbi:T9SS type A sorting domain-containing protein [Aquimarina algiphila]|uniref:T9SS type A sorting domain-containing protein n=1 Tax=Aquimarina algiphila TaxID=2047982 RepID=A0A554VH94_9FLAO|nr:T9SS type A sorting domain-containing protein [Aquimarina algiphila]TSE06832.1 T9SS type A sorting domain-containing protein [Aquimarina algiphila]
MLDVNTEIYSSRGSTFLVYPNPIKGEIYIDRTTDLSTARCSIFDPKGHLVKENKKLSIRNTISFVSFPAGMYTIKICDENRTVIKKFLKL